MFSQATEQTAFNSELGIVPVTFHKEARIESTLPCADTQCTVCYSIIMHLRKSKTLMKWPEKKKPTHYAEILCATQVQRSLTNNTQCKHSPFSLIFFPYKDKGG